MSDKDKVFPKIVKNIENLIEDEEGNIPGSKLLVLGTMMVILGNIFAMDVFAGHSSHSSHSSHESHVSHQSHTSHSNGYDHSNSGGGGGGGSDSLSASEVPGVAAAEQKTFSVPQVDQTVDIPEGTPNQGVVPTLGIPAAGIDAEVKINKIHIPSETEKIE